MEISLSRFFVVICLMSVHALHSQDVHYSQKLAQNNQRNPVWRSDFQGNWQAASVYRNQWQAVGVPFVSSAIWFSKHFSTSDPTQEYFGGISYQHDQSGDAQLSGDFFQIHFGTTKKIGDHKFGVGVQGAVVQKSFDPNGLTFPSQYDRNIGGFNENLANGEAGLGNQLSYFDLGIGLNWEHELNADMLLKGGLSSNHLLEPEESFLASSNQRERTYETQWMMEIEGRNGFVIQPYFSYYYSQASSEGIIGSALRLPFRYGELVKDLSPFVFFRTGPARNTDAMVVGSTVGLKDFTVGLSYDINVSDLELASNYRGGFEITLVYTAPYPKIDKIRIPCVRY